MCFLYLHRYKKNSTNFEVNVGCENIANPEFEHVQCSTEPFTDIMPNGFLGLFWLFIESIGFFQPFIDGLHVNMKEGTYTNLDRIKTLIASIAIGCKYGKDINHKLGPYPGAAECCHLIGFPDQSQINRFLRKFDFSNIREMDSIFEQLLRYCGLWRFQRTVDIDFDSTGIVVHGKTYQL